MLDCQVASLENAIARYMATGSAPGPLGAHHPSIAPFGAFRAADGWLVIAAGNDALFRRLCEVVGSSGLGRRPAVRHNPDCAPTTARAARSARRDAGVGDPSTTWLSRLEATDIPCGPINDVAHVLADPQVRARNMVVPVDDRSPRRLRGGRQSDQVLGLSPIRRDAVPCRICREAVTLDRAIPTAVRVVGKHRAMTLVSRAWMLDAQEFHRELNTLLAEAVPDHDFRALRDRAASLWRETDPDRPHLSRGAARDASGCRSA